MLSLSILHSRPNCWRPVRCSSCFRLGHISGHCRFPPRFPGLNVSDPLPSFRKSPKVDTPRDWFHATSLTGGPPGTGRPTFTSFGYLARPVLGKSPEQPPITLAWSLPPPAQSSPGNQGMPPSSFPSHFCQNHSTDPPTSAPLLFSIAQKTPTATVPPSSTCESLLRWNSMAYRFIDPMPFLPRLCTRIHVEGRKTMSRAVLGAPRRHNSDLAIFTIEPLPDAQVSFQSIREVLDDFLRNHK